MKAILLAGGYGTRLYPLTLRTPKPLLPVAGKPILQYTIDLLAAAGIKDIIISLKENQEKIEHFFGNGKKSGVKIRYIYEPLTDEEGKMGSVGAINYVLAKVGAEEGALVIGGDNFIVGLDMRAFTESHRQRKAHASIALFELASATEVQLFGVAKTDSGGRITHFQEKPKPEEALSKLASTAIYALHPKFVNEHLPAYTEMKRKKGEKADKIGDLWEHFVKDLHISGYPFQGIWGDIGNCEDYLQTNRKAFDLLSKQARNGTKISPIAKIAKTAEITNPVVIEEGCVIKENAKIGPYVHLMKSCEIGVSAQISNSILFEGCRIGDKCIIENSIIDGKVAISQNSSVTDFSMVGFECRIGEHSNLSGAKVYPKMSIQENSTVEGELLNSITPLTKELRDSCYWKPF
ncbi:MAG: NDP-sugar synthase [Candidatus Micrarchaeota archaeon]